MRTTIEIPEHLLRRAKAAAALSGQSLKQFLIDAVERKLHQKNEPPSPPQRVKLPLVKSKAPGSLHLNEKEIAQALALEDSHALSRH